MRAAEARDLWLGELSTNGSSGWTIRNYRTASDRMLATVSKRRGLAETGIELEAIDRDDIVAALAAYAEETDPVTAQLISRQAVAGGGPHAHRGKESGR